MKLVSVYADQIRLFVIVNNDGFNINVDVNVKNQLIKVYVMKDIFLILITVVANVINLAVLVNIQTIQFVSVKQELIDPLVEERNENIDVIKIDNENEHIKEYSSCIVYVVFFSIFFTKSIVIAIYFVQSHWHFKKYLLNVDFNIHKETLIY